MIIFGTRGTTGRPILAQSCSCPACNKEETVYHVPAQRYFHIFWIPTFPTSKKIYATCSSCGALFNPGQVPISLEERAQIKTPIWTFIGLMLIGVFFLMAIIPAIISAITK